MDIQPGKQIGHYTIIEQLGQGGMSQVFRARDTKEDRDVVLKFPNIDLMGDVSSHERFRREVKIGQMLHHPHIQQLYELAYVGNHEFLVLEYIQGDNLRHLIRDKQYRFDDFSVATDMGVQIGSALAYAHEHHVAHRDLKPENIIVTPDVQAKVMDFGIALLKGARRVTWGPMSNQVGTPDYMSPEQIQGGRGDSRTDVYALGMLLYEMISHRLPYTGDNALAVMNQHVNSKAPPIHKFRKDVPPALEEIIMKAVRLRPADRWQTVAAMVGALQDWDGVDVAALHAEREAESEGAPATKAMGKLPIPVNPMTALVALLTVISIGAIVTLFLVLGHYSHH